MARVYKIGNNIVNAIKNSLTNTDNLNERTNCSFVIYESSFHVSKGMNILIVDGAETLFAGIVFSAKTVGYFDKTITVRGVDYSALVDKRIIAEAYDDTLAGDIVKDLITKYFTHEDITVGTIQDGPLISRAVLNYQNGNIVLNYIADLIGFYWEVDKDKKLNFFARATYSAPFNLTDTTYNYSDFQSEENATDYRNRQYTRGGMAVSDVQTRSFLGDGETQTWTVDLPIAKAPTITVNGVAKTSGIRGLETGKDFYWQKNDKTISQELTALKLTSSNTVSIQFEGFYPIIVVAEDIEQIDLRKSIEGGSGIYEKVFEENSLGTQQSALEYTNGLLEKYGVIPKIITFNTIDSGLKAGQIINITHTNQDVDGGFLIDKITARADGDLMLYSVQCLDGDNFGGWAKFFKKLVEKQEQLLIRENEILLKLTTFKDKFQTRDLTDIMTYTLHQYLICGTSTICGEGVII